MFGQSAAVCCGGNAKSVAVRLPAQSRRTVAGRDIPFPMVSPYQPIVNARVPATGLTAFPMRAPLGRRYYGLGKLGSIWTDIGSRIGFPSVTGTYPDTTIASQGVTLPGSSPNTLQTILNSINAGLATIPAIISANRSQPYYNPAHVAGGRQTVMGLPVASPAANDSGGNDSGGRRIGEQAGGALGNLGDAIGKIVIENPLLVLGGGLALVLLMMKPPSRR